LKGIYGAPGEAAGRAAPGGFGKIRNGTYPVIRRSREKYRGDVSVFFNCPPEIRRTVYTANAIEGLNYRLLRKQSRIPAIRYVPVFHPPGNL
jgi:putative transposase